MNFQDEHLGEKDYQKTVSELPKKEKAPVFPGRPENRGVIKSEDIVNLKIALNTAKSFESFLEMV
jgi:hypothetical protein